MKTKGNRKELSKKRQDLTQKLALLDGRMLKEQTGWRAGAPGAAGRVTFCREEIDKLKKELRQLWTPQRAWASHGFCGTLNKERN